MTLTLLTGFSAIGGLLAGYVMARQGPKWLFPALIGLCGLAALAFILWSNAQPERGGLMSVVVLFGAIAPFSGCALVAGLIAILMRKVARDQEDE